MTRASEPSGLFPNVWSDSADDFDHSDLAANWDAGDAGISRLDGERMPLGSVVLWWHRQDGEPDVPWQTGSPWQPCDGRTILNANHDLGGGDLVMPDMRNMVPQGAATPGGGSVPSLTYPGDSIPAPATNGSLSAGGVDGVQGSMSQATVPAHYHDHEHIHHLARGNPSDDDVGTAQRDDAGQDYYINADASGSGHNIALTNHTHHFVPQYTSVSRDPQNANTRDKDTHGIDHSAYVRNMTTLQKLTDGTNGSPNGQGTTLTTPGGGVAGDLLQVDARPASRGFVFLMKVRFVT